MASPLHSVQSTAVAAATSLSLPEPSRHYCSLARSSASYVVRVHTKHGIKTLSFNVLAELFGFTAKKAADCLGISSRTLIRVCRSLGIRRWPYLGFRSEKNVKRIRQEAMRNLRRKLDNECEPLPTTVLHPDTPSLIRNASAKRLLRVKITQPDLLPPEEAAPSTSLEHTSSWCSSPSLSATTTTVSDDDEGMSGSNESKWMASALMPLQATSTHPHPCAAPSLSPSMLTTHGFNLDPHYPGLSEKSRGIAVSTVSSYSWSTRWTAPGASTRADTLSRRLTSPMPPFNLLVNASVLTSVKSDIPMRSTDQGSSTHKQQQQLYPRTMSMQDILACS